MSEVKQLDFHHPDKIRDLIDDMLKEAVRLGATDAEIAIGASKGVSVVARKGEVESIEWVPFSRCLEMIKEGKIIDSFSILALLSYRVFQDEQQKV